jgi:lysophospholipase L1-like esterase
MRLRKLISVCVLPFLLSSCGSSELNIAGGNIKEWEMKTVVNFMMNLSNETYSYDEFDAIANNLIYQQIEVEESGEITPPEVNPSREEYSFGGWYKESSCFNAFDFANEIVESSLFLYASWEKTGESTYQEPEYIVPDHIDDTLTSFIKVNGILNGEVKDGIAYLPYGSLLRLQNHTDDVRFAINYSHQSGATLKSAVASVENMNFTIVAEKDGIEETTIIAAQDIVSAHQLSNTTYEQKATAYEIQGAEAENYHVMMAGSSSMEFWVDYANAMHPIVCYNHGIGGTTVSDWTDHLNERLVYPYMPKIVTYYVGINDLINSHNNPETIINNVGTLFTETHKRLPDTKIFYVLFNRLPGYFLSYSEDIDIVNEGVKALAEELSYVTIIDAGRVLLKSNGVANAAYFRLDCLHLSAYGYILWGKEIFNAIKTYLG